MFQSTHPRGVRQEMRDAEEYESFVSIHAPAWGATSATHILSNVTEVSIHAPAWGATKILTS